MTTTFLLALLYCVLGPIIVWNVDKDRQTLMWFLINSYKVKALAILIWPYIAYITYRNNQHN